MHVIIRRVSVTSCNEGDAAGTGFAARTTSRDGRPDGIAFQGSWLYVAAITRVRVWRVYSGGTSPAAVCTVVFASTVNFIYE